MTSMSRLIRAVLNSTVHFIAQAQSGCSDVNCQAKNVTPKALYVMQWHEDDGPIVSPWSRSKSFIFETGTSATHACAVICALCLLQASYHFDVNDSAGWLSGKGMGRLAVEHYFFVGFLCFTSSSSTSGRETGLHSVNRYFPTEKCEVKKFFFGSSFAPPLRCLKVQLPRQDAFELTLHII